MLSSAVEKHSNFNSSANEQPSNVVESNMETYWWNMMVGKVFFFFLNTQNTKMWH